MISLVVLTLSATIHGIDTCGQVNQPCYRNVPSCCDGLRCLINKCVEIDLYYNDISNCCIVLNCQPTNDTIILSLLCLCTTTFTVYRVKYWLNTFSSLSSKMMISPTIMDSSDETIAFPTLTVCNVNPARGRTLYMMKGINSLSTTVSHQKNRKSRGGYSGTSINYELFTDAYHGHFNMNASEYYLNQKIYQMIEYASHDLRTMLYMCRIGQQRCSSENFTKSLLPFGACYTLNTPVNPSEEIQLVLDPQGYDYLVPNNGLVGFRLLLHRYKDPLSALASSAIFAGLKFHTIIHATGIKTIHQNNCIASTDWRFCVQNCMKSRFYAQCSCHMEGLEACTILDMMKCGKMLDSITEQLSSVHCNCSKDCETTGYSLESVTQAVKSPLFLRLSEFPGISESPFNEHQRLVTLKERYLTEAQEGSLIQLWAFLREANRTAFEKLREQSFFLVQLRQDMKIIEKLVYGLQTGPSQLNSVINSDVNMSAEESSDSTSFSVSCVDTQELTQRMNSLIRRCEASFNAFNKSFLMRDIPKLPSEDFHIHLVRLFFLRIDTEFQNLTQRMSLHEIQSDVAMLDHRRKAEKCPGTTNIFGKHGLEPRIDLELMDTIPQLNNYFFHTNERFNLLKREFQSLVRNNKELIDSIPSKVIGVQSQPDLLLFHSLMESSPGNFFEDRFVTLTVKMSRDRNKILRLESIQNLYNPLIELSDVIVSGVMLTFILAFLCGFCFNYSRKSAIILSDQRHYMSNDDLDLLNHQTSNGNARLFVQHDLNKSLPKCTQKSFVITQDETHNGSLSRSNPKMTTLPMIQIPNSRLTIEQKSTIRPNPFLTLSSFSARGSWHTNEKIKNQNLNDFSDLTQSETSFCRSRKDSEEPVLLNENSTFQIL